MPNLLPLDERLLQIHDSLFEQGVFHDWTIEKDGDRYLLDVRLTSTQTPNLNKAKLHKVWTNFSGKGWGSLRDVSKNKRKVIQKILKTSLRGDFDDANYCFKNKIAINYNREGCEDDLNKEAFIVSAAGINLSRYRRIAKKCDAELVEVEDIEESHLTPNWCLIHNAFEKNYINILKGEKPITYEYNNAHNRYSEADRFDKNAKKIKIYEVSAKQEEKPFNSYVQETFASYLESDLFRKGMRIAGICFTNSNPYDWNGDKPFLLSASLEDVVKLKNEIDTFAISKKIGRADVRYNKDSNDEYLLQVSAKSLELIQQTVKKVA